VTELRRDRVTGRLVLVAPGRAARPHTNADPSSGRRGHGPSYDPACPFCPGNESHTPPEITRTGEGAPGEAGWRVRVFPNLYPFAGGEGAGPGATGTHEVVALSPDHSRAFGQLVGDQPCEVLSVSRERARALAADGHAYVQVLVNQGRAAGASIAHPHAQIVALDFVPPAVEAALRRFEQSDPVADDVSDASEHGRGLLDRDAVRAWCPEGAVAPFEVRLAVTEPGSRFTDVGDDALRGIADALRDVLAAIAVALDDPPYNVVVHTAPVADHGPYHWWVEVAPRVSVVAGFEMGTGVRVNTVPPERAAEILRESGIS
jgi:UDPglucose--hexose-1-phosphate uridylyltransferase